MDWEMLASPFVIFFLFLGMAGLLYAIGGSLSPRTKKSKAKLSCYACGEDIRGGRPRHSYTFFQVAFIFTVFHTAVLFVVLIPSSDNALFGLLFLGGLVAAVAALLTSGGEQNA